MKKTARRAAARKARHGIEEHLLVKNEWFRLATEGSRLGLWYWDEVSQNLYWDAKTREMLGVTPEERLTPQSFVNALHPDDGKRHLEVWRYHFDRGLPYEVEYRVRRPDHSIRWIHSRGSGYYDQDGNPVRMVGVVFDVTERRAAEQERIELSGQLINAQEEERRRLARELHDDFSQRLALLATELDVIAELIGASPIEASKRARELWRFVSEVGSDLHSLSHRLHSSRLEILGLAENVHSYCKEFAEKHAIQIDVIHKHVPKSLPSETKLCVFRILQEALRNVNKHSHASRVEVQLQGNGERICLSLSDNGIGFDPSRHHVSQGIGVYSMRERARMLGGTFEIQSRLSQGTQIAVTVPVKCEEIAA